MMTVEQMRIQVDKACRDEADFDETMELLATHIAAHPDAAESAEFLRMRIALFDAAYDQVSAWKDRKSLLALQPDDIENQLVVLTRQHRSAHWIASDAFAEKNPSPDDDALEDSDDEDEYAALDPEREAAFNALQEEIDAYSETLENEAIHGLGVMMTVHAADITSVHKILQAWDDASIWSPWIYYASILWALAAHPHDVKLKKAKASFLVSLCDAVEEQTDKTPIGYFEHMIAGRFHAVTVFDAIAAIEEVDTLANEPVLLTQKANLLKALDDYPGAAASLRLVAKAYENALQSSSEDEREDLQASLDDALQGAAACEAGRDAVHAAHFAALENSMARLNDLPHFAKGGEGAPDYVAEPLANLKTAVTQWQTASQALPAEPDEEEKLKLNGIAAKMATSTMSLVKWDQIELQPMQKASFMEDMNPWFDELAVELEKNGLQFLSWFQNPSNVAALKREAPGQCWVSAQGDFALVAEAAGKVRLKRCVSLFSDGSLMLTSDSRGGTYFVSGPKVRGFPVFKSTSITEMLKLHQARVIAQLAATPGLAVKPITSLADIEAFENQLRTHGREFRLAHGITDREIRGMNVQFNDYFAGELKREVNARIAALTAT